MGKTAKKSLTKADAQVRHAKKRALERYSIELNDAQYEQLCQKIRSGDGVCLGRQSNRVSVWRIKAIRQDLYSDPEAIDVNVVYDKERHRIVTFLPEGIRDAKGVSLVEEEVEG